MNALPAHPTNKIVGKGRLLWAIYLTLAAVTAITESGIAGLFIAAGIVVWFWRVAPAWLKKRGMTAVLPVQLPPAAGRASSFDPALLTQIGLFLAKTGAYVDAYINNLNLAATSKKFAAVSGA